MNFLKQISNKFSIYFRKQKTSGKIIIIVLLTLSMCCCCGSISSLFNTSSDSDGNSLSVASMPTDLIVDTLEATIEPTDEPTVEPTIAPTIEPTDEPTVEPTDEPTVEPTIEPTLEPSIAPVFNTTNTETIVINYIFYDGVNGRQEPDEYVSIINKSNIAINMLGWTLKDESGKTFYFPNITIEPGNTCSIYTNESHPESCGLNWYYTGSAIWNNSGDCAVLKNASNVVVSEYCY